MQKEINRYMHIIAELISARKKKDETTTYYGKIL